MKRIDPWPVYYPKILHVGNPSHHVGVCTLWTEREVASQALASQGYYAVGNLYSSAGINALLRNVLANPTMRYLVLWGADLSASGVSLTKLFSQGVDKAGRIAGDDTEIDREIARRYLEMFRHKVELVDLRGKSVKVLTTTVSRLKKKKPFMESGRLFKSTVPRVVTQPSEQTGFRVEAKTVAQTWLRLLNIISKYGRIKSTRYTQTNELKEVFNLVAVVSQEDMAKVYFPDYLPFSRRELKAYYPEIMTARRIKGTAYNYGARMRNYRGKVDQIGEIKKLLNRRPDSKKMIAVLPDPVDDWLRADKGDTPCLTQVLGGVQDKKFWLTAHFRSQDMVHGWPRNTFALRQLQKEIADSAGYPLGKLTMIAHSAHIYSDDFKLVKKLLAENYIKELGYKRRHRFRTDPRGNWLIEIDENKRGLVAKLFTSSMARQLAEYRGKTAMSVYYQIADWDMVGEMANGMYLGEELAKAELALNLGLKYRQDKPLKVGGKVAVMSKPV